MTPTYTADEFTKIIQEAKQYGWDQYKKALDTVFPYCGYSDCHCCEALDKLLCNDDRVDNIQKP